MHAVESRKRFTPRASGSSSAGKSGRIGFDDRQWPIVRRMIHASGDLELARSVVFTHAAAEAGVLALRERVPIVTDVTMVAAGINKPGLASLHAPLHCFIDQPGVADGSRRPRAYAAASCAMERACREFAEAVFVVGNAPTAFDGDSASRTLEAASPGRGWSWPCRSASFRWSRASRRFWN